MADIIKVYKEHLPAMRFVGKRYTDDDRSGGGFGHKWGEWFHNGWFDVLENQGMADNVENGYIGFMRCAPGFEYWIGAFMPPGADVPEGYGHIDLAEGDAGICWIKGSEEDGSIYSMHEKCLESLKSNGMAISEQDEAGTPDTGPAYFFQRYNCPRFTEKDSDGNVILDYGVYLAP